ncbi:DEAD/DEAH box helicase [Sungkyunkwania multivorans]|uniref:RNA helicase n=1 Tax=Sungkyunkwania multivorans TaxID=1173618 RepID=A0ABW3CYM7_9FLAO
MNKFELLGLEERLVKAIEDMGFETPSEVQEKAIPVLLTEESDLVALAQTGTGKTAAFGFPLIQRVDASNKATQGLILSPTRELCLQITNELKNYSKYVKGLNVVAVYGGANIQEQARQVKRGAQIIVATPGRMQDMMRRGLVDIRKIDYCILDEADEMLNMGFYEDITNILADTPEYKSTWLFSATMPKEVSVIAKKFMTEPIEITVGAKNVGSKNVQHEYYTVGGRDRYQALKRLADANPDIFSVIFCRTKRDTQSVAEKLIEDGYNAAALHGDLSQNQRDLVMKSFRNRQIQMLVATDVAARGIDVDDITHVINYQLPDEIETYTHRSGRTGRAGKSGVSMVIVTKSELRKIKQVERIIKKEFEAKTIPTGMEICEIQLYHLASKIKNTEVDEGIEPYLPAVKDVLDGLTKEELIQRLVSVEFSRFHNYYSKSKDLNVSAGERRDSERSTDGSVRYFINIGERDGYDWKNLKDYLRDTLGLDRDDVFRVDVKESFSFFNTDAKHQETVLSFFKDYKENGRFINVEVSTTPEGGGGRRNRKRNRKDGGGGRRDRDRGDKKEFKGQKRFKKEKSGAFDKFHKDNKRKRRK